MLDLDLTSKLSLADPLAPAPFNDSEAAVTSRALAQRPDLVAAQERVAGARATLRQAQAAYIPTASATGQTYNGGSTPPLGTTGWQVGVSITLPLLDSGSRPAAVHQAQAAFDHAQAQYEQRRLMVEADAANAWREFVAARANLGDAQAAQENAAENLRVARLRMQAGKGIQLEVLDALSLDASAREMLLRAEARYDDAVAGVHHAAGDPRF
jgi:outer membrane protein TolC